MALKYPATRKDETVEQDYFGTKVADPYRWLEDNKSEESEKWMDEQCKVTDEFLGRIEIKEQLKEKIKLRYNYEKIGTPFKGKDGKSWFYYYNSGLQNQYVLFTVPSPHTPHAEAEVFFDPNTLSDDGTVSLGTSSFSEHGKLWAYALSKSGSDWHTVHVKDVAAKKDLDDKLEWVKFSSISWTHDEAGFFYARFDAPNEEQDESAGTETNSVKDHKVYYHRIGTPQSEDRLIYQDPEHPEWMFGAAVNEDGKYVLMGISEGCKPETALAFCETEALLKSEDPSKEFKMLFDKWDGEYHYVGNVEKDFMFITTKDAPRKRLMTINIDTQESKDVIPHSDEESRAVLSDVEPTNGDKLLVTIRKDVVDHLYLYTHEGKEIRKFDIGVGAVAGMSCDRKYSEVYFKFTSFLFPGRIFFYDFEKDDLVVFKDTIVQDFDPEEFDSKQVFYPSEDGTKIPMFLVFKRGLVLDGSNPCLLYGYGGFNISLTPSFNVNTISVIRNLGAIYALANIRGGGEYGEAWHRDGMLFKKQNCFTDFQWAAKYLHAEKYTSPSKLAIYGGSNGGTLVNACANQAPELFGCVVGAVGVLDMLRFHKFTIGHAWKSDFACADDSKEEFEYIYKYSPLHNIRSDVEYPPMMLKTADHDDRVVPLHSFKMIAALQAQAKPSEKPIIIRIERKAGHGAGKPTTKIIDEAADTYGFMAYTAGWEFRP